MRELVHKEDTGGSTIVPGMSPRLLAPKTRLRGRGVPSPAGAHVTVEPVSAGNAPPPPSPTVARVGGTAIRLLKQGPRATMQRVAARVGPHLYLSDEHLWFERDLDLDLDLDPAPPLPEGLVLVPGTAAHFAVLEELHSVGVNEAQRRLDRGAQWWLVFDGDQPLFSCWVFRDWAPVLAAPGGRLALPPNAVVLEDSITTPAARGRGIAPRTWNRLAADLAGGPVQRILTKVAVDNAPSRKAVGTAHFTEIAIMSFRRVGPWKRTTVRSLGPAPAWLLDGLRAA